MKYCYLSSGSFILPLGPFLGLTDNQLMGVATVINTAQFALDAF
jgi:hypothetical protein